MGFPTTTTLDDFNRADDASLGADWTELVPGSTSGISSNQAYRSSGVGTTPLVLRDVATHGPNVEAWVEMPVKPGTSSIVGIIARATTLVLVTLDGYEVRLTGSAGTDTIVIYRTDNGTPTQLGDTINQEFSNGDALGIQIIGNTIKAWGRISGVWTLLGSREDSTYPNAGYIGLFFSGSTTRLDNFSGGIPYSQQVI